jgi:hypothetical protein
MREQCRRQTLPHARTPYANETCQPSSRASAAQLTQRSPPSLRCQISLSSWKAVWMLPIRQLQGWDARVGQ